MKVRLTDPKCMHLRWRKVIFDNPFTRLKYILCSPLLSLINFSWKITLARITPYTGGQVQKKKSLMIESAQITLGGMKNLNDWKCPNNAGGHKRKFSITEGAHTKLGGMKKYPKDSKILSKNKKRANTMVLKIKWRKQRERAQAQHWGAPWTILQIKSKVQKCMNKKSLG